LPSGRELVKSQTVFLKLARFYNTGLPECTDVISNRDLKIRHQRYNNETISRIPPKTAIDTLGQKFLSEYFHPAKNVRETTDNDQYLREIIFYTAAKKNIPAIRNWSRSNEWTDPSQYPQGN
jgi:hypothetical protein